MKPAKIAKKTVLYCVLLILAFIFLFPFLWMILSALKTDQQIFSYSAKFLPDPANWKNFIEAWQYIPLGQYYLNSIIVSGIITISQVITSAMAAYVFAKLYFPYKNAIFLMFLGIMMIPTQVTIIPLFILIRKLNLIDTYAALILPFMAYPYGAFLLRQFFMTIPVDLEDAARIDGCSRFWILTKIIMPLSKPAIMTLAMLSFMWSWNSFLWPLVVTNNMKRYTLQVGLAMLRSEVSMSGNWSLLMAATVITIVPVLIFLLLTQKYIIKGISLTGLKS
ncbi:MAG: carbohydrate ABC transporter permease [Spirochaetales bacterium]|nr:carbohydrate ABC transporter permease [Spirochaetales bacterium]